MNQRLISHKLTFVKQTWLVSQFVKIHKIYARVHFNIFFPNTLTERLL